MVVAQLRPAWCCIKALEDSAPCSAKWNLCELRLEGGKRPVQFRIEQLLLRFKGGATLAWEARVEFYRAESGSVCLLLTATVLFL